MFHKNSHTGSDSVVNSICCSSRELRFGPQNHMVSSTILNFISRRSNTPFWPLLTPAMNVLHKETCKKTPMHAKFKILKECVKVKSFFFKIRFWRLKQRKQLPTNFVKPSKLVSFLLL